MGASFVTGRAEPSIARRSSLGVYAGLMVVCAGAVGWAIYDRQSRSEELGEIRRTLAALEERPKLASTPRRSPIYVSRDVSSAGSSAPAAAEARAETEAADEDPSPAPQDEDLAEPTPEQRAAASRARYQHIQSVFESQTAADYDPVRASRLESSVNPALEALRDRAKDLKLGQLECRGRMCGVDVSFKSSSDASLLFDSLTRATTELGDSMPLVHLVMLPQDQQGEHSGRAYFEWRPTK